jgi:hypothetical protein
MFSQGSSSNTPQTPIQTTLSQSFSSEGFLTQLSTPTPVETPSTLQSIGQPSCYLFKAEYTREFYTWSSSTEWAIKNNERKIPRKVLWGSIKRAGEWDSYQECALRVTGEPKLFCNRCSEVIQHPQGGNNSSPPGNSGMITHLRSLGCTRTARQKGLQPTLFQTPFREAVS